MWPPSSEEYLVGAHDHRHRVPADDRAQPALDLRVARDRFIERRRDRVHIRRVERRRSGRCRRAGRARRRGSAGGAARSTPSCSTTASSASSHSPVSTASMSAPPCGISIEDVCHRTPRQSVGRPGSVRTIKTLDPACQTGRRQLFRYGQTMTLRASTEARSAHPGEGRSTAASTAGGRVRGCWSATRWETRRARPLYVYSSPAWRPASSATESPACTCSRASAGSSTAGSARKPFEPTFVERLDAMFATRQDACPDGVVVFVDAWTSLGGSQFLELYRDRQLHGLHLRRDRAASSTPPTRPPAPRARRPSPATPQAGTARWCCRCCAPTCSARSSRTRPTRCSRPATCLTSPTRRRILRDHYEGSLRGAAERLRRTGHV